MNPTHIVKKIPIEELIDVLSDLYEKGVDFIDIVTSEEENRLSIVFNEEYLSEEAIDNFENDDDDDNDDTEEFEKKIFIKGKLLEDDFDQLL